MKKLALISSICLVLISCNDTDKNSENRPDVLMSNVDTLAQPADDFFLYANGGWIKANAIPNDQSSWGIGNLVVEENLTRLRKINEDAAKEKAAKGTASQKIGDFWTTAMDSAKTESLGIKPLAPYLEKINAITDVNTLMSTIADMNKIGVGGLFSDYVGQDDKNSEMMSYKLCARRTRLARPRLLFQYRCPLL